MSAPSHGAALRQWRRESGLSEYRAGRLAWPLDPAPLKRWRAAEQGDVSAAEFDRIAVLFAGRPVFTDVAGALQIVCACADMPCDVAARHVAADIGVVRAVATYHAMDIEALKACRASGDYARKKLEVQRSIARRSKAGVVSYRSAP